MAQALTRPGFDLSRHPWSALANGDLGWIQMVNLVLTGILVIAFSVGLGRVLATGRASAVDRARVRAAVHYFVLREGRARRGGRSLAGDQRMINEVALRLNRPDLALGVIGPDAALVPAL